MVNSISMRKKTRLGSWSSPFYSGSAPGQRMPELGGRQNAHCGSMRNERTELLSGRYCNWTSKSRADWTLSHSKSACEANTVPNNIASASEVTPPVHKVTCSAAPRIQCHCSRSNERPELPTTPGRDTAAPPVGTEPATEPQCRPLCEMMFNVKKKVYLRDKAKSLTEQSPLPTMHRTNVKRQGGGGISRTDIPARPPIR